jgi:hypothetical protein
VGGGVSKNTNQVDEENFKLIGSFNDIFVVIACLLLLFSSGWVLNTIQNNSGYINVNRRPMLIRRQQWLC